MLTFSLKQVMNYDKIFWAGYMQEVWNLNYSNVLINTINMCLTNFQKKN